MFLSVEKIAKNRQKSPLRNQFKADFDVQRSKLMNGFRFDWKQRQGRTAGAFPFLGLLSFKSWLLFDAHQMAALIESFVRVVFSLIAYSLQKVWGKR